MFYLLAANLAERSALIEHLRQADILAVFHYVPLHSSPFAKSLGLPQVDLRHIGHLARILARSQQLMNPHAYMAEYSVPDGPEPVRQP